MSISVICYSIRRVQEYVEYYTCKKNLSAEVAALFYKCNTVLLSRATQRLEYQTINAENIHAILQKEVGLVFVHVLEESGVYKCTPKGREDFMRFVESL